MLQPLKAHIWDREPEEHYCEPFWCSERLFAEEKFDGPIWDPCCGFGRIPDSAIKAGLPAMGTDIVDRGYLEFEGVQDFLKSHSDNIPNIVCNPPFNIAARFAEHALALNDVQKVAMIFPTARLNAAHWLRETPLARVWLMTPRPSMPPGCTVKHGIDIYGRPQKVGSGKMDFCWLIWSKGHTGPAELRWLRRDA